MSIVRCDDYDEILEVEKKIDALTVTTVTEGPIGPKGDDGGAAVTATVETTKAEAGAFNGQLVYVDDALYMWYDQWYKRRE